MHSARGPQRWLILIAVFVLSLPAVTTRIYSSDEIQYFSYLRSLWFDRDLSFENEYRWFYDRGIARAEGFHETFLERQTETGRRINFATMGAAILWGPFYAIGHGAARLTGAAADGYSPPYVAAVAYGSAVYGFLAIVIAILAARRLELDAFGAAAAIWFGTPLLFYMYVAPVFSHACSAFAVAVLIYVWLRVRETWSLRGMAALGAAGALTAMVREQDVFFILGVALDFAIWAFKRGLAPALRDKAAAIAAAAAAFAIVYAPQAAAYLVLNGHLGPHSSVGRKMNWASPHALQVLFSPEHGFFFWTPLALIALTGLVAMGRQSTRRQLTVPLLSMVLLQVYVSGAVESWTVAGGFGQRRFVALTAVMVIGYAALRAAIQNGRWMLTAVTVLAVYWNLALSAEFATGLMDRQKLEPGKNAYHAFVTLPKQAPSLIYRYLFDRASFYQQRGTP